MEWMTMHISKFVADVISEVPGDYGEHADERSQ
jgi:hypothetical protein